MAVNEARFPIEHKYGTNPNLCVAKEASPHCPLVPGAGHILEASHLARVEHIALLHYITRSREDFAEKLLRRGGISSKATNRRTSEMFDDLARCAHGPPPDCPLPTKGPWPWGPRTDWVCIRSRIPDVCVRAELKWTTPSAVWAQTWQTSAALVATLADSKALDPIGTVLEVAALLIFYGQTCYTVNHVARELVTQPCTGRRDWLALSWP